MQQVFDCLLQILRRLQEFTKMVNNIELPSYFVKKKLSNFDRSCHIFWFSSIFKMFTKNENEKWEISKTEWSFEAYLKIQKLEIEKKSVGT